jgi:hypothetical protein
MECKELDHQAIVIWLNIVIGTKRRHNKNAAIVLKKQIVGGRHIDICLNVVLPFYSADSHHLILNSMLYSMLGLGTVLLVAGVFRSL